MSELPHQTGPPHQEDSPVEYDMFRTELQSLQHIPEDELAARMVLHLRQITQPDEPLSFKIEALKIGVEKVHIDVSKMLDKINVMYGQVLGTEERTSGLPEEIFKLAARLTRLEGFLHHLKLKVDVFEQYIKFVEDDESDDDEEEPESSDTDSDPGDTGRLVPDTAQPDKTDAKAEEAAAVEENAAATETGSEVAEDKVCE
ncbi:hypothetical protein L228DRAFT_262510 [Xylona heveae TC161]|uniref:Uncharacterized protein n=1 Tax=Xylona heveae (strain CBS 132557 / TC161) TaxID=1328760 RepID=A0A165AJC5_XYLHT|nr:hypothetical protein L228DRAFT_262510 [Xylona heveae TC161]KZF20575.1 hypothetical protein L228DRAFT_262510 [Xylona heveae TC161]